MLFGFGEKPHVAVYASRRKSLLSALKDRYGVEGKVLLISGFERDAELFTQESSFYYLTGINEPGVALLIDAAGHATLYMPRYKKNRAQWTGVMFEPTPEWATKLGLQAIEYAGEPCEGYSCGLFFKLDTFSSLIAQLQDIGEKNVLYALAPDDTCSYVEQRLVLGRIQEAMPALRAHTRDISAVVADLRSGKDMGEIELIKGAVTMTIAAHEAAAQTISNDMPEWDVQASIEGVMTIAGARRAFPSIVASGKNSTVLHYTENSGTMKNGDLVVVDIGVSHHHYAADLTRTYPVSGTFSKRQREVYDIVLAAQDYIADLAQPGFYLSNKNNPDKSLYHKALQFFTDRGYGQYFIHGIGHYVGLDVHDAGDYSRPLREGDVITIEPGLYIPEEQIGIRIEDNYWIIKKGAICLSEDLPKTADDIESFMQQAGSDDEAYEDEDESDEYDLFDDSDEYEMEH